MDKGMEEIKDAVEGADFELLKELLTKGTPEVSSEALYLTIYSNWDIFRLPNTPKPTSIEVEEAFNFDRIKISKIIQIFLEHGADVNYIRKNFSTFSFACHKTSASIVKMMIDHGADLNLKTQFGLLPIQVAFLSEDADIMNLFLNRGIDAMEINRLGLLHIAAKTSREIVEKLVKLGADINNLWRDNTAIGHAVNSKKVNLEVVKYLIDCGADLNVTNGNGGSALEAAVSIKNKEIAREMVKLLLEHGANANLGRQLPLTMAAQYCDLEIVKLLLQYGAFIDGRQGDRVSPIVAATSRGNEEIVELLLDKGARQVDILLICAIKCERKKIVEMLLKRGYDPNCKASSNGWNERRNVRQTALSSAVYSRSKELVKLLLDYGAQVDGVSVEGGKTPLHLVTENNFDYFEITQILLDYGADINKEYSGETALTIAVRKERFFEGINCLIRHMVLVEAQSLYVSEKNLNACDGCEKLKEYKKACKNEMEILKTSKFYNSDLSYLDIFLTKDISKLESLANNHNITRVLLSDVFKNKFPIYGKMIVEHFVNGILRKKDFELFRKFINYLSTRNHDQLPKLPFTVVSEIFSCLNEKDVSALRQL